MLCKTILIFYACKSPDQILGHTLSRLSAWLLQMATSSSSRVCEVTHGLTYGTLKPLRVTIFGGSQKGYINVEHTLGPHHTRQ